MIYDWNYAVCFRSPSCSPSQRVAICKKDLYVMFRQLAAKQRRRDLLKLPSYHASKQAAHQYQEAKAAVHSRFSVLGHGQWQQLPEELQHFA